MGVRGLGFRVEGWFKEGLGFRVLKKGEIGCMWICMYIYIYIHISVYILGLYQGLHRAYIG